MAELSHFLFNSDYPTDKIVYLQKGEYDLRTDRNKFKYYNTHITTPVYLEGQFKLEGSDTVYPLDNAIMENYYVFPMLISFMYNGECWVMFGIYDFEHIDKTAEFEIWGIVADNEAKNTDINATINVAKPKVGINSDENYPRFIGDGTMQFGETVYHNLGFTPKTKHWIISNFTESDLPDFIDPSAEVHIIQYRDEGWIGKFDTSYSSLPTIWADNEKIKAIIK